MDRRASGFPGGLVVKNLPANAQDTDSILGQEDPLEKKMTTHSSILAWKISWTEEPGGLQSMGHKESNMTKHACTQKSIMVETKSQSITHKFMWI